MKSLIMLLALSTLHMTAYGKQSIDQSLDAEPNGTVDIEHIYGYATITGWDKNIVQVTGELGDRTEEFIFSRRGSRIVVEVEVESSRRSRLGSSKDDNLTIFVPKGSRVNYESTQADVAVTNIAGGLSVDVVNGDVNVESTNGRIRLETVNGDITTKSLGGTLDIETINGNVNDSDSRGQTLSFTSINGNIEVKSDTPDIRAETVNGDIELTLGTVTDIIIDSVNGTVSADLDLSDNGDVRVTSVGGGVSLNFQKDVSAKFDIQGLASGNIKNELSEDRQQKAKYSPNRWLAFSLNDGSANVDVSTVSGRISLGYR